MLSDYMEMYIKAKAEGDTDKTEQIERELASLGMDKLTLGIITSELANMERT